MSKDKQQQRSSFHNYRYYFLAAAVATALAGIVHLCVAITALILAKIRVAAREQLR